MDLPLLLNSFFPTNVYVGVQHLFGRSPSKRRPVPRRIRLFRLTAGALLLLLLALTLPARAQTEGLLHIDDEVHSFLEKQQTLGHLPAAFLFHQPLSAYEARRYLDSLAGRRPVLSGSDQQTLDRLRGVALHPGARWLQDRVPWLYANGRDLLSTTGDDYALAASPLLYATAGYARQTDTPAQAPTIFSWRNTRGMRAAGHIDIGGPRLFFETRLEENQERPLAPQFSRVGATAPRLGHITYHEDRHVYDYFQAGGVVGLHSEHFEVRFGRERNRWGYGPGSLLLSDYGTVYDQLQVRTSVWRLQYVNLFTRFTDGTTPSEGNPIRPRRYGAFHSLALDLPGRVQLELFETVVFATDSTAARRRSNFDLAYLNPVIFYRSVEHDLGSPDNVLLGGGASWIPVPGLKTYGQLLLDELRVSEIGNAWWANKWGWLLGLHWAAPLGLDPLSVRFEYARQRPYLYSHRSNETAFVHYGDGLGHPAGPNSVDAALFVNVRPAGRLEASLTATFTRRGRNTDQENFGADPTRSYNTRVRDRPVELLQGVRQDRFLLEAQTGYELLPQLTLGASFRAGIVDDAERGLNRYVIPALMLRWGLPFESQRY